MPSMIRTAVCVLAMTTGTSNFLTCGICLYGGKPTLKMGWGEHLYWNCKTFFFKSLWHVIFVNLLLNISQKDFLRDIFSHVDSVAPQQENYKPFTGKDGNSNWQWFSQLGSETQRVVLFYIWGVFIRINCSNRHYFFCTANCTWTIV